MVNDNELLAFDQVLSDWLPISRSKLYGEIRRGRLKVTKLGRRSFIRAYDLNAYISSLQDETE